MVAEEAFQAGAHALPAAFDAEAGDLETFETRAEVGDLALSFGSEVDVPFTRLIW